MQTEKLFLLWGERAPLCLFKDGESLQKCNQRLQKFYKNELEGRAAYLFPQIEERTVLYCKKWRTRGMKTRLGSCNMKARRIWLNIELPKYSTDCLEYVILHELVYLKVQNHGPEFKSLLRKFMPRWKVAREKLSDFDK
ncbi:MAG: M48 family metallopeptidase [Eggerthellaceae bacterium]|nr:M48 family metallopeptidase [Eggerthellaceae bacterium]